MARGPRAGRRWALAAVTLLFVGVTSPEAGTTTAPGTLDDPDVILLWGGVFENVAVPSPDACTDRTCDTFTLDIAVPADTWTQPGGVLVALDWTEGNGPDGGYHLGLVVHGPDGHEVGHSYNLWPGAAVLVPNAVNGTYRVTVVPFTVVGRLGYRLAASVEPDPPVEPVRDLLPNLVAYAPTDISLSARPVPGIQTDRGMAPLETEIYLPTGCHPSEMTAGAQRCLRFDITLVNEGEGPFELRHYRADADNRMYQHVYSSDGGGRDELVGSVEFHPEHGHFHYQGFARASLYQSNDDGTKGELVAEGEKLGFCMVDVVNMRFGGHGGSEPLYPVNVIDAELGCGFSYGRTGERGSYTWMGMSVGWADVYPSWTLDQYIEVSGVPDGRYVLEVAVDLAGTLIESTSEDNSAGTLIQIEGETVTELPG